MIKDPPRNHTSIYISPYLKANWDNFSNFVTASGFNSLNSHVNHVLVENFHKNYAQVMKNPNSTKFDQRLDMYDMTPTIIKSKIQNYSDGELYDLIKMVSDFRNLIIREAKKRDIKL